MTIHPAAHAAAQALANRFDRDRSGALSAGYIASDGHYRVRGVSPNAAANVAAPAVLRWAAEHWDHTAVLLLGDDQEQAVGFAEWLRNRAAEIEAS